MILSNIATLGLNAVSLSAWRPRPEHECMYCGFLLHGRPEMKQIEL